MFYAGSRYGVIGDLLSLLAGSRRTVRHCGRLMAESSGQPNCFYSASKSRAAQEPETRREAEERWQRWQSANVTGLSTFLVTSFEASCRSKQTPSLGQMLSVTLKSGAFFFTSEG